jgi:hypothetical protein
MSLGAERLSPWRDDEAVKPPHSILVPQSDGSARRIRGSFLPDADYRGAHSIVLGAETPTGTSTERHRAVSE